MRPKNLQGKPWNADTANMVLNRIKYDVAQMLLQKELAKGVLPGGRVVRWYKPGAKGEVIETDDYSEATSIKVDPLLVAMRHSPRDARILTRKLWALFLGRRREEFVESAAPFSFDDPMPRNRNAVRVADHVPWVDEDLPLLHSVGMYLDWKPQEEWRKPDEVEIEIKKTVKRGRGRPRKEEAA